MSFTRLFPHTVVGIVPVLTRLQVIDKLLNYIPVLLVPDDSLSISFAGAYAPQQHTNGIVLRVAPRLRQFTYFKRIILGVYILPWLAWPLLYMNVNFPFVFE